MVTRFVATHVNRDGMRTLTQGAQGRYTYETPDTAQEWIDAAIKTNSPDTLASIYGAQAINTFEVRPCECWPVHFDPKGVWFD